MGNCGQACPYNTLDGCKVKEYNAICPLSNMATPITEYKMTHADRIRAMSDEELADAWMKDVAPCHRCVYTEECECDEYVTIEKCKEGLLKWLKQPVGDDNDL